MIMIRYLHHLLSLGTYLITDHGDLKNAIINGLCLANAVDSELSG